MESKGMLKDIKKKKLNTVQVNPGKQLSPAEAEAKQKVIRKLQVSFLSCTVSNVAVWVKLYFASWEG